MKRNLIKMLKTRTSKDLLFVRGKNDWDSDRAFPHNQLDEHEEPKEEEIIQEIFEKNYYHFFNKGKLADTHGDEDKFVKYRMWQHLYVTPK
jgi:hypothetical protein